MKRSLLLIFFLSFFSSISFSQTLCTPNPWTPTNQLVLTPLTIYTCPDCFGCSNTEWRITGTSFDIGGTIYSGNATVVIPSGSGLTITFLTAGPYQIEAIVLSSSCPAPCDINLEWWGATINAVTSLPPPPEVDLCKDDSTILSASTCTSGVIKWYKDVCSGTALNTGQSTYKVSPSDTSSYFYSCGTNTCNEIIVNIIPPVYDTIYDTICYGGSISFNSTSISSAGLYNDTLSSNVGCDSVLTLDLYINPILRDTILDTVCFGVSYSFGSNSYNSPGYYSDTVNNALGCDSISVLDLFVRPILRDTLQDTICFGVSYSFGGNNYSAPGIYSDTVSNALGCDSISVLDLFVRPILRDTLQDTICKGVTYSHGGNNYSTSGFYPDTLSNALGCDSISVLDLFVRPILRDTLQDTICQGVTYSHGGNNYGASGFYPDTVSNALGCDSISVLDLYVKPVIRDTVFMNVCYGKTVVFGGNSYNSSGYYDDSLSTATGCDSISTLHLLVDPIIQSMLFVGTCEGIPFNFGGQALDSSGIYRDTIVTADGCDSVSNINLTVYPIDNDTTYITICFGQTYNFNGRTLDSTGSYADTTVDIFGCFEVETILLNVDGILTSTLNQTICTGQSYTWNGNTYNSSGTYRDTVTKPDGCDSVSILNLTVTGVIRDTLNQTICFGSSFNFGGNNYSSTGYYSDSLVTASGCDSISVLNLVVNPIIRDTLNVIACFGSTYNFGGSLLTSAGTYHDTLVTAAGCDSISVLYLSYNPIIRDSITDSVCAGGTYLFGSQSLTSPGIYSDTLVTAAGCDSISTLTLSNFAYIRDTLNETICFGSSYNFGGNLLNTNGTYIDTLSTALGCDSISVLNLYIAPIIRDTILRNICFGSSYNFGGNLLSTTGTYSDTLVTAAGCDSISVLYLSIDPIIRDTITRNICFGSNYNFGGTLLNSAGVYSDTLVTALGCDSISVLYLSIDPIIRDTINETICLGSSYNFGGTILNSPGTYNDTLVTLAGCDSISTLNLTISTIIRDTIQVTNCYGLAYNFGGTMITIPGTYNDTLITAGGCDSISTLEFDTLPIIRDSITDTICFGIAYNFGGTPLTTPGIYSDTLITAAGCDSISTISLTVSPIIRDSILDTICFGQTRNFGPYSLTATGIYSDTINTASGCDSISTLLLYVEPIIRDTIIDSICFGTSYNFGGNLLNTTGIYSDTLANAQGCDSISVIYLTINPILRDTIYDTICEGQTYIFNGNPYSQDTLHHDTLVNPFGCDSIASLALFMIDKIRDTMIVDICDNQFYVFNGTPLTSSGFYSDTTTSLVTNCDSITTVDFTIYPTYSTVIYDTICEGDFYDLNGTQIYFNGIYYDTLTTINGCDSTFRLHLNIIPTQRNTQIETLCDGDTLNFGGTPIYEPGIYEDTITLSTGCYSVTTLIIQVNPTPLLILSGDTLLCHFETGQLHAVSNVNNFLWNTNEITPSITTIQEDLYYVTVEDQNNCKTTDSIYVKFEKCSVDTCHIFTPNAFTPNGDGFNDNFYMSTSNGCKFKDYYLRVYTKWGQLVYESTDEQEKWDGTFNGEKCKVDTYVWIIDYKEEETTEEIRIFGHVNLVK